MKIEPRGELCLCCRIGARDCGAVPEQWAGYAHAICGEPPEKNSEIRQVVVGCQRGGGLHVHGVGKWRERSAQQTQHGGIANRHGAAARHEKAGQARICVRGCPAGIRTLVVERLRPSEILTQLDRTRGPTSEIGGQPLDDTQGAFAAAKDDCVRDIGAQCARLTLQVRCAEEISEVWDDPVIAGIDEEIVVERLDVPMDRPEGALENAHVRLELVRRKLLRVAYAVDFRQATEKRSACVGGRAHGVEAVSVRCSG